MIWQDVASITLGGGAGAGDRPPAGESEPDRSGLYPLTAGRAKPAIMVGGSYRLIDIPISNAINSGIVKNYVVTQYNSQSLGRHIRQAFDLGSRVGVGGCVEVLNAQVTPDEASSGWFHGSADAVRHYAWLLDTAGVEDVLILSGEHLFHMDFSDLIVQHRASGADVTVCGIPLTEARATEKHFGMLRVGRSDSDCIQQFPGFDPEAPRASSSFLRVEEFYEKVHNMVPPENFCMGGGQELLGLSEAEAAKRPYFGSMAAYVFKNEVLQKVLLDELPEANNFADLFPGMLDRGYNIFAYPFLGYWENVGRDLATFLDENLRLVSVDPFVEGPSAGRSGGLPLYSANSPFYTTSRQIGPAIFGDGVTVEGGLISNGVNLGDGCMINNSIVGLRGRVGARADVRDSMIMGLDSNLSSERIAEMRAAGRVPLGIGCNAVLRRCIVDKNAAVGDGAQLVNREGVQESFREDEGFCIRNGIIVIMKGATIPHGFVV